MTTPKLCHHKAVQQGYVTLSGKERYLGHWSRDQKKAPAEVREAYDTLISRWLANGRRLPEESPPCPTAPVATMNGVILKFVAWADGHYAKNQSGVSGEADSIKQALRVVSELFGRLPVAEFGPKALKQVRAKMVELKWARTYVNHQTARVRRMVRWGVAEELVPPSVLHGLQAVNAIRRGEPGVRESDPVAPVPAADLAATLPFMPPLIRAMIDVQLLTGMRPGEVVQIRGCDLDRSRDVWVYRPNQHKNAHRGHRREVPIGPKAQAVLAPWLKPDPVAFLFNPAQAVEARRLERSQQRVTPRFPSHMARNANKRKAKPKRAPGDRYTTRSYTQAVRRACERADLELRAKGAAGCTAWHPGQLRHNAGSAIASEFGIETARLVLGHKHGFTTEIYTQRDLANALAVAAKVG